MRGDYHGRRLDRAGTGVDRLRIALSELSIPGFGRAPAMGVVPTYRHVADVSPGVARAHAHGGRRDRVFGSGVPSSQAAFGIDARARPTAERAPSVVKRAVNAAGRGATACL